MQFYELPQEACIDTYKEQRGLFFASPSMASKHKRKPRERPSLLRECRGLFVFGTARNQ